LPGQRDVLSSLKSYFEEKEEAAIEAARKEGVELVFEDE
jgi:hypothetical protein